MSGFDQWLSGSLSSVGDASALPVWACWRLGGAAVLCRRAGVSARRAARPCRCAMARALLLVGAGLMWVILNNLGGRDRTAARHVLDARAVELTLRAIAPGSPLACLDAVANETVEAACEKSLFANPETVAAAVAYVDARLALLADSLEFAARDRSLRGLDRTSAPRPRGRPLRYGRACAGEPGLHGGELRGVQAVPRSAPRHRQSSRAQFRCQRHRVCGSVECSASNAGGAPWQRRQPLRLSPRRRALRPPASRRRRPASTIFLLRLDSGDQHHERRAGGSRR